MILISKFFQRVLNSFEAIFRRETSTALVAGEVTEAYFKISACLFSFIGRNYIFFAYGRRPNVVHFRFKSVE